MDSELERLITTHGLSEQAAADLRRWATQDEEPITAEIPGDDEGPALPARYTYECLLGMGGMGEVIRVRDTVLNRAVAMKILRHELSGKVRIAARFEAEAMATGQLEHPSIVPVYDYGTLPDGRAYFTMQEIKGHTLSAISYPVHTVSSRRGRWSRTRDGWTLERLLDAFRHACQAIAHAHERGVLHRDLKPDNVMVGRFGEVLVVDWGLAKVGAGPESDLEQVSLPSRPGRRQTRLGAVAGTPAYMPPEQAHGHVNRLGPHTDVYALGSILYHLLSGRPPYDGDPHTVLEAVRTGPPAPLVPIAPVSEGLLEIVDRAMARDSGERYPNAGVLAEAVIAWQDGDARRAKAAALVSQAHGVLPEVWSLRDRAALERDRARELAATIESWQPVEEKAPLWEAEDQAERLNAEAEMQEHRAVQLLRGALTHDPDLPEAHIMLADLYRQRHEQAERARDASATRRYELLLEAHDRMGAHQDYLVGDGTVTLHTSVPVLVDCYRFVERGRRLVPEHQGSMGMTPLRKVRLARGSYLLKLSAPGHRTVDYPVFIERNTDWHGIAPGETAPRDIWIPPDDALTDDEVYVPAGWYWRSRQRSGQHDAPTEHVWVEGFAIHKFPVTNRRYLEFLNDLVASGRAREAKKWAPRHRGEAGEIVYGRRSDGTFALVPDSEGDMWEPDWPVILISYDAAMAYTGWLSARTGRPYRLPSEDEWEKSARGADHRQAPWGDAMEPTWACVRDASKGRPLPAEAGTHGIDRSVFGLFDLAGNTTDYCERSGDRVPLRGGAWSFPVAYARIGNRRFAHLNSRSEAAGVRIARTLSSMRN